MSYFDEKFSDEDTVIASIGLTPSEIATSMVPVLIGMIVVGLIAVLMLL